MITITCKRYKQVFIAIVACNNIIKEVWLNLKFIIICLNFNTV